MSEKLDNFMYKFIVDICNEIGPRASASEEEHKAGDKIEVTLKEFCDEAHQEEFLCSPKAGLHFIRYGSIMIICSIILYWCSLLIDLGIIQLNRSFSLIFLIIAVLLETFAMIYFIFEVMRMKEIVDFLFPKRKAKNIVGVLNPKEEVKHYVIFSAHHDSAYEYNLFYYLKWFGAAAIFIGFVGIILSFVYVWLKFIFFFLPIDITIWFIRFGITMLIFSPIAVLFIFFISKNAVLGAYDNLSGVAILLGIAKILSDNRNNDEIYPKNTQVKLISFACEEAGLRGSKRYVKAHLDELQEIKPKVVNIDSISTKDQIVIVPREILVGSKHDKQISDRLYEIAKKLKIGVKFGPLPFGASDATPFTKNDLTATSIMSFDLPKLPPFYHTREDTPKVVDKEALGQVVEICVKYIKYLDNLN